MNYQCVKSVQIRSFFWSVFSCIRTEYRDLLRIQSDTGKYGSEKTLFLDTFHAVFWIPEWGGSYEFMLVRPSVCTSATNYSQNLPISFFWSSLQGQKSRNIKKWIKKWLKNKSSETEMGFAEKLLFVLKFLKRA